MTVVAICSSSVSSAPMVSVAAIDVVAGAGIAGDRYFATSRSHAGQNITLVEAEEVERFNARNGTQLSLTDVRRNVITRDVRLADLLGRDFRVGEVRLRGVELCEPCATLASSLAARCGMRSLDFVRDFTHRCGLRADVVTSGRIHVGDTVSLHESP